MNKYTAGLMIGLLSAGLTLEASGQTPTGHFPSEPYQSTLKESVPFSYEYNLQGPATIESESIKTSGTIKSICASYEFEGEVRLEVSANAGTAYTKIINGEPLTDGFIPGNELRFRVNIAKDSILKKIIIGYTDSSGASTLYQNPDLKNYKYRKEIYITGGSEEVFNYPIQIKIGDTLPIGFKNVPVMFTAADGQTPLYYYIEQGLIPKGTVPELNYWVKIPQIPKQGTTIYIYYERGLSPQTVTGHFPSELSQSSSMESVPFSNGAKVFPFFDDFSGTILNEEKWNVSTGLKKEYSVKDGYLILRDCSVLSKNFKMKYGIIEFKAKAENNASIQAIIRGSDTKEGYLPFEQMVYSSAYPGAEHTIAINDMAKLNIGKPIQPLTYYIYKVVLNQTGIIFERYSADYEKQAQIQFLDVGSNDEGYLGLKADAAPFDGGSVYFDWVRARPYVEVEPTVRGLSPQGTDPEVSLKGTVPEQEVKK